MHFSPIASISPLPPPALPTLPPLEPLQTLPPHGTSPRRLGHTAALRPRPAPASLLYVLSIATFAPLTAQDWTIRVLATNPAAATFPRLAYDSQRNRCVEFGGWNAPSGTIVFQDTWEYDGTTWILRAPATVPDERDSHVMAYDSARGRTIMFGGWDFNFVRLGQTWEWDGTDWVDRQPLNAPSGRILAAMAYDTLRGVTVLFGGADDVAERNDTWEWNGTNWTQRNLNYSPSPRTSHAMAYDVARGRIVLFGGRDVTGLLADTWEYDGTDWFQILVDGAPAARVDHQMVFDTQRARVVLVGGADALVERDDTWEYDARGWRELYTAHRPPANSSFGMAYDTARNQTVLFGGYDGLAARGDTVELGGGAATWRTFGTGCVGSGGLTPRLVPVAVPALGTTTRVDVAGLPPGGGLVYVTAGFSDTTWGPAPLPFDLGVVGLTGCRGYTSADTGVVIAHTAGTATWTLAIPAAPALGGLVAFLQALSFDTAAPRPFPGATSNAAEANLR
jgi:hypothetical protein